MKNTLIKVLPWVIIFAMIALLIPGLILRINSEKSNNSVIMAVLYNDLKTKISKDDCNKYLDMYMHEGIDTVAVMEDDLNKLVVAGEVTSIKYNVLLHKYDDESMVVGEAIREACPNITLDSHIVLAKRPETMKKLAYHLPRRYSSDECFFVGNVENMDIYVFLDGHKNLWDFAIGYNEEEIAALHERGFNISLIHKVKNYSNTEYIQDIESIINKYDVEYLNLKEDAWTNDGKEINTQNYEKLSDIINTNNMTLVVTENTDQLSNQKFMGYKNVFDSVMKDGGTCKVMRSYETYDDSQADESGYKHRVSQFFNSTIDRNIRFITITQITDPKKSYSQLADYTFLSAKEYKNKIEAQGFEIGKQQSPYNYFANERLNYAASAVIMVMAVLIMLKHVFSKDFPKLTLFAILIAAIGFAGTYVLYFSFKSLISLYPTLFCVILSSFAMTMVLSFLKNAQKSINTLVLTLGSVAIMLTTIFAGTVGMGAMLSGIDYYVNNDIFRGIKLSLIIPIAYTAIVFYLMFMNDGKDSFMKKVIKILDSEIKVYWVILAGVILAIGSYYIIRSGNVNSISVIEQKMRTAMTELFAERPRTKEFLIGYPALVLLVYYVKKTDIKLLQWLLAIASSILAASVTNSFCHVFTDYSVIAQRTINGLIIGSVISVAVFIGNLIVIKIAKALFKMYSDTEMEN